MALLENPEQGSEMQPIFIFIFGAMLLHSERTRDIYDLEYMAVFWFL